jgi:ribosomal protein S18 acetylase RimI-like enzyme
MSYTVRFAKKEDIPALMSLLRQVNKVHHDGRPDLFVGGLKKYTDEELAEIIPDDSRPVFVNTDPDGHVLGYAFCVLQDHRQDSFMAPILTLYIDDICVDASARGQHVGKALYDYVIAYAREIGCYNVTLNVWECNPGARKFYEAMGMVPQKTGMEKIL